MRRLDHRGIDADHRAARIDQRPAGVTRIQRGIGLNDIFDQPAGLPTQRAADRADDAGRHGVMKAVWIPNRNRDLPNANRARVGQRRESQRRALDADSHYRKIGMRVAADQVRACGSAIRQDRLEAARPADHVIVCEDQAVRAEDDTRAAAAIGVDAHDRRRNEIDGTCDGLGIGVEQAGIVGKGVGPREHDSIVRGRRPPAITRMGGAIR
jgi:hypothetical protein